MRHDPRICRYCWWRKNWRWAIPLLPLVVFAMIWHDFVLGKDIYYHE